MFQRFRDLPDQGLYGVIGVLAVAALYVIGFVIKNSKNVNVDFVLFSDRHPADHADGRDAAPRRAARRLPDARAGAPPRGGDDRARDPTPPPVSTPPPVDSPPVAPPPPGT